MTKENLENMYKNFRDAENNYEAPKHKNTGLTATDSVRKRSKKSADDLLEKFPELAKLDQAQEKLKKIETPGAEEGNQGDGKDGPESTG